LVRLAMQKITASSTIALGPFLLLGFWASFVFSGNWQVSH
jgi:prepilin signal peptidase PulO-like enzyme (type II secretory pathway)